MLLNSIRLVAGLIAAIAICGNASAQFGNFGGGYASAAFGGIGGGGFGGYSSYGALGGAGVTDNSCHRKITQSQAESLWAGYCTESCAYQPAVNVAPSFGGFGGLGGHGGGCAGGGCAVGGCAGGGCSQGGFGYPSDCGCDGGSCGAAVVAAAPAPSCGHGGCKLGGGKLAGAVGGKLGGCGAGGCPLRGRGTGLASSFLNTGGGGCLGCKRSAPSYAVDYVPVTVAPSVSQCGSPGGYFNEFVGAEYGNAGMQSSVSGCASGTCGGGAPVDLGGYDGGYGGGMIQDMGAGYSAAPQMGYGQPTLGGEVQGIVNQAVQGAINGAMTN